MHFGDESFEFLMIFLLQGTCSRKASLLQRTASNQEGRGERALGVLERTGGVRKTRRWKVKWVVQVGTCLCALCPQPSHPLVSEWVISLSRFSGW